ncbi:unnamed protein product, partial [Rotaria sp. Silwood2]
NNQQQQQINKRTRSFKDQSGMTLSTLSKTQSLPVHDEQLTPTLNAAWKFGKPFTRIS